MQHSIEILSVFNENKRNKMMDRKGESGEDLTELNFSTHSQAVIVNRSILCSLFDERRFY